MTVPDYVSEPDAVDSALAFLAATTSDLSDLTPGYLDNHPGAEAAVLLLAELRTVRQALASVEAFIEAAAADRLGKGKHEVRGLAVEVRGGAVWKDWRHDDLAWNLCRDIAVDPTTGEINPDVAPIVDLVRSRLLNAARPSWRTNALRSFGIDPGDYATWTPGRRTVTLTADVDAAS